MDGATDPGKATRERAAAEAREVCKGKPLEVKQCSEDIRARYSK
jgi:hypothetical protein